MNSYSTMPQEATVDQPILDREVKFNMKTVLGAAAFVSFVIGSLTMVAVAPYQPSQAAAMAFHHKKKLANGAICSHDVECASGDCHKGPQGDERVMSVCKDKSEEPSTPSSKKFDNGHSCAVNADCKSGHCHDGKKGTGFYEQEHVCKDPSSSTPSPKTPTSQGLANGKQCTKDEQCASDHCPVASGTGMYMQERVCKQKSPAPTTPSSHESKNQKYCDTAAKTFSKRIHTHCRCNEQCESTDCHGTDAKKFLNEGVCKKGHGTAEEGDACSSNYDCKNCEKGTTGCCNSDHVCTV